MNNIELQDVVAISRKIDGNNDHTGVHYLLGYLWATLSDEQQNDVYKTLKEKVTK